MEKLRIVKVDRYDLGKIVKTKYCVQIWKRYWISRFDHWSTIGYTIYDGESHFSVNAEYDTLQEAELVLNNLNKGLPFSGEIEKEITDEIIYNTLV